MRFVFYGFAIAVPLCVVALGMLAYPPLLSIVGGAFALTAVRFFKRIVSLGQADDGADEELEQYVDSFEEDDSEEWEDVEAQSYAESNASAYEGVEEAPYAVDNQHEECEDDTEAYEDSAYGVQEEDTTWQLVFGIWSMVTLLMLLPSGFLYGVGWLLR